MTHWVPQLFPSHGANHQGHKTGTPDCSFRQQSVPHFPIRTVHTCTPCRVWKEGRFSSNKKSYFPAVDGPCCAVARGVAVGLSLFAVLRQVRRWTARGLQRREIVRISIFWLAVRRRWELMFKEYFRFWSMPGSTSVTVKPSRRGEQPAAHFETVSLKL